MAEQEPEHKRVRVVRRILRWLSVGFLTLLLALMLILQAPWKSTVLLAAFLAACTVLPKPLRKWFWLSVGAAVLALVIWVLMPENNQGWRPYTFDAELAALEAKYAIPDEENAALAYDAILEPLDIDSNQPEFFLKSTPSSINEPWLSKDHPEMAEWLKDRQDTIAKLLEASRRNKCYFSVPSYSWDMGQHMDRLASMRPCGYLLISAGNNDIGEGRIDAGLEKYLCIIRIADHLYQQPAALDFLVGSALESLALTQLNRFVIERESTAEQLQLISNASGDLKNNWGSQFKRFLETDKLLTKNTICSMAYEVNPEGEVRLSRNPIASVSATQSQELPTLTRVLYKAKTIFNWFFMPSTPQKAAEIFDASFDRYNAMTEPDFDWVTQPQNFDQLFTKSKLIRSSLNYRYFARLIVELSEGAYFGLHDAYLRSLAVPRSSRVLIAVKQYRNEHGTWPDDLNAIRSSVSAEALIDPQNNSSFVYKLTGEAFTFYSKGKNDIDEEGRKRTTTDPNSYWPDDILFWPPKTHKTEQENNDQGNGYEEMMKQMMSL